MLSLRGPRGWSDMSKIQLHADAALNAMADAGLKPADIDGIATAGETPVTVAHYLGLTPKWVDGTTVGGCSCMIHVHHTAAAIESGLCKTVLITHGESGRSGVGRTRNVVAPTSLAGQFEQPYGPMGPPTLFTIPVLRYMIFSVTPAKKRGPRGERGGPGALDSRFRGNDEIKARAIGDGLGRAARMGGEEPARHLQDANASRASRGRLAMTWR
jgi:hypothetical protein